MAKRFLVTMRTHETVTVEAHAFTPQDGWMRFDDVDGNFVSMIPADSIARIDVDRPKGLKAVA